MDKLTLQEIDILWHSLGLDPHEPWKPSHRNNFAAGAGQLPLLRQLATKGLMQEGGKRWDLVYFRVTPAGVNAAQDALPKMTRRKMRNRQRYLRYLDLCDVDPDMTFRKFLEYEKREKEAWA